MTNSRQKGKRGELEVAGILREYGFADARRGQQYSGANGDADVVGVPGVHIEVKRYKTISRAQLEKALQQAKRDARADEVPVVLYREDNKDWRLYASISAFCELCKRRG